jgi:signal transduction histidine kinase
MQPPVSKPEPLLRPAAPRRRPVQVAGVAVVLLMLAGLADWLTGPEIAFSILYLVPVGLVSWRNGRWAGLTAAVISGATWLGIELVTNTGYSSPWIPYWNGVVRLTIFCLVAVLLAEVVERKRVEAALEQQRGILQSILDSMKEGVIVTNHDGRLLVINPAAEVMLDVDGVQPRPATVAALLAAGGRARPAIAHTGEEALLRALRGELVPEAEWFLHAPGRADRWLRIHGRPWLDPDGRNHGSMVVLSDITARRNLERQIAEVSDREQRRLGQDLHDGLCQHLVSTTFAVRMLADALAAHALPEARDATRIAELLDESITQARDVARGLYLVPLETGGLASALEELAAQVRGRFQLNCTFTDRGTAPLTEASVVNDLFRIAQEAVSNAVKHANAQSLTLTLESTTTETCLRIADDGDGLATTAGRDRGLGLHMMRYRARMMGADMQITSRPGGGTVVACVLPRWPDTSAAPPASTPLPAIHA